MKLPNFVGNSTWTQLLRQRVEIAAQFSSNILVSGPSGTGKELIARAIHDLSPRANHSFVPVDCTSLHGELFASHLFGHVKGAFTGADHDRLGCIRVADGGTILLDEIGEMNLEMQARLLRVIQERVVIPVGSDKPVSVDVRIVAATNRNLLDEVKAGRFRLDLYYRLNVVQLETIPLAERVDDIEPLVNHFLKRLEVERGFPSRCCSARALSALQNYSWPGNVRELQNVLERAAIFAQGDEIGPEAIPQLVATNAKPAAIATENDYNSELIKNHWASLAEMERKHVEATLAHAMYNQSAAARLLGIDRASLARKIKQYSIEIPQPKRGRPYKQI